MYDSLVIRRLYVHNFRCLENFELPISGNPSTLLIGNNGTGKTTVAYALEILQKIARSNNRVADLVKPKDMTRGRTDVPVRLEVEIEIESELYQYALALEYPDGFRELRVLEEKLTVGERPVYTRERADVRLYRTQDVIPVPIGSGVAQTTVPQFRMDWHLVALPVVQERSVKDPIFIFKQWLARMLIIRPTPGLIFGNSEQDGTLQPNLLVTDLGAWFSGLLALAPSAYSKIDEYLKQVMPDLKDIKNPVVGQDSRSLFVQFSSNQKSVTLPFGDLSDGEKCFMICALVLAANDAYGPVFCFWDEPDNYLALSEVGQFVLALRRAFQSGGQFIATSHNPEAIRRFSNENTLVFSRKSHLEPTVVRRLTDLQVTGDLVGALIRGDVEP